jgi:hypothetical protein
MVNNYTNINKTSNHLQPQTTVHKKDHDICHWKSMSQHGTGMNRLWGQTGYWDHNPPTLNNWITSINTDVYYYYFVLRVMIYIVYLSN